MAQSYQHGEIRPRLKDSGLTEADLAWLDSFNWSDAAMPAPENAADVAAYRRREAALNASIANQLLVDRLDSIELKLAAALGAHIANWGEKDEDDED